MLASTIDGMLTTVQGCLRSLMRINAYIHYTTTSTPPFSIC